MSVPHYAKTIVAVLGAVAAAGAAAISDGNLSSSEIVTIVLAVLTALGVYAVPNRQDSP